MRKPRTSGPCWPCIECRWLAWRGHDPHMKITLKLYAGLTEYLPVDVRSSNQLALDLAEIFKPVLVDRLVFSMLNKREIQDSDFRYDLNRCVLKESAGKKFARSWDERLKETIQHRVLKKAVSYKTLIRLECYKIQKHIVEGAVYKPFKMWW